MAFDKDELTQLVALFDEQEKKFGARLDQQDKKMDGEFAKVNAQFTKVNTELVQLRKDMNAEFVQIRKDMPLLVAEGIDKHVLTYFEHTDARLDRLEDHAGLPPLAPAKTGL